MGNMGKKRRNLVSDEQIIDRYITLGSTSKVENDLGVSQTTIIRVLEKHGIERTGLKRLYD